ncbi:limonene-1,2-epoxide hydrolase family protein [Altererythrobacter sp. MF3-039]|uniref:limonene-1,2-epoxide hydrolase family protein n=1 Tax=Altererythrobacter sp. MF3-039 TaxID=3252901 RepID=UPI00390C754D
MTQHQGEETRETVVRAFIDAWTGPDLDRVCALLGEDIHYHNIPMEPLSGKPAVEAYLRTAGPFEESEWELRHIASSGEYVLTERVDRMVVGGKRIALPLMGIFQVSGGLIREWRDYFDLAMYRSQMT